MNAAIRAIGYSLSYYGESTFSGTPCFIKKIYFVFQAFSKGVLYAAFIPIVLNAGQMQVHPTRSLMPV